MEVKLIEPYGFCVGVELVMSQLEKIVNSHPNKRVFCVGQLVHNKNAIEKVKSLGVEVISGDKNNIIDNVSEGVVVFSAHGTDEKIIQKAKEKGLVVYDLACPFVKKTFEIIKKKLDDMFDVIYIGIRNHDEANAALSISNKMHFVTKCDEVDNLSINNTKVCIINQTTLSIIDIKEIYNKLLSRFPNAEIVDEICNSTRVRQQMLLDNKLSCDGIIIVGDNNSNNSKSLYDIAKKQGYDTIFIEDKKNLDFSWLNGKKSVAIMSGSSTQRQIVDEIFDEVKKY